ncbi:MAG: phosphate ABC transporter permease PstA [Oscillospiraceae bacterium]
MINNIDIVKTNKRKKDNIAMGLIYLSVSITVLILFFIIGIVIIRGIGQINFNFLFSTPSILNKTIGILPNIINTLYLIVLTLIIATPIGVGSAIYLNEYAKKGKIVNIIIFATETIAGIPSIIFGLFGFMFFGIILKLSYSILSGSLTLALMILPIIIRTTQETLKTVPKTYKEGAFGLGAKKWYIIRTIVLPYSLSGILSGIILAIGRIVAESAALIFTAGIASNLPKGFFSHIFNSGGSLTIQLYRFTSIGDNEPAFGIALILIIIVLIINFLTRFIGEKFKKEDGE